MVRSNIAWMLAACWLAGFSAWPVRAEAGTPAPAGFQMQPPCEISAITDEPGRAGSDSAFRVRNCVSGRVRLTEVLVFTAASIRKFDDECMRRTGHIDDDGCWESTWRPHVEDLRLEQQAFESKALPEKYARVSLNGVPFLVHEMVIASSGLTLREYVTYQKSDRVTIWVLVEPDASADIRAISAADREASDRLAGMLKISAAVSR